MGGARLTIRDFVWDCGDMADPFGSGVAQVFVVGKAGAGATTPTDVVVEHSVLMPGASQTVAVGESLRSGVGRTRSSAPTAHLEAARSACSAASTW